MFDELTGCTSADLDTDQTLARRPLFHRALAHELGQEHILKTHDCAVLTAGPPLFAAGSSERAIYIVRNPLDVAVSYASHINRPIDWVITLMANEDARIDRRDETAGQLLEQYVGSWSHNVSSWVNWQAFPVLLVRYEDLVADPNKELLRLVAFLGWSPDIERAAVAVRSTEFGVLRRREQDSGFSIPVYGDQPFFRSGRIGDGRLVLSKSQVTAIIEDHGHLMGRMGYLDQVD